MDKEILVLFRNVLLICDSMGLIGKEMFAIDGCKMPSNASKEWSGTRADFVKKKKKIEKAIGYILQKHRSQDQQEGKSCSMKEEEERHISNLRLKAQKIKRWLSEHEEKIGKSENIKKSNVTDNESAKMATSHGVIQGYDGVVADDAKHQVIVHAETFGEAQEHDLFQPMVEGIRENFNVIGQQSNILEKVAVTADSGFHTEANVRMLAEQKIDGYIADNRFRKRDPRFATPVVTTNRSEGSGLPGGILRHRTSNTMDNEADTSVMRGRNCI